MDYASLPRAGQDVLVIFEREGTRITLAGRITHQQGNTVRVTLEEAAPENPGAPIAVLAGTEIAPTQAPARGAFDSPDTITLAVGRWRETLNRRGAPRFPVVFTCKLESAGLSVEGQCSDISLTGAAIELPEWDGERFDVVFSVPNGELRIPGEAVFVEPMLGAVVVHVRFRPHSEAISRDIERLVIDAQREFSSAQRYLALRGETPTSSSAAPLSNVG